MRQEDIDKLLEARDLIDFAVNEHVSWNVKQTWLSLAAGYVKEVAGIEQVIFIPEQRLERG